MKQWTYIVGHITHTNTITRQPFRRKYKFIRPLSHFQRKMTENSTYVARCIIGRPTISKILYDLQPNYLQLIRIWHKTVVKQISENGNTLIIHVVSLGYHFLGAIKLTVNELYESVYREMTFILVYREMTFISVYREMTFILVYREMTFISVYRGMTFILVYKGMTFILVYRGMTFILVYREMTFILVYRGMAFISVFIDHIYFNYFVAKVYPSEAISWLSGNSQ